MQKKVLRCRSVGSERDVRCDDSDINRPLSILPFRHTWLHRSTGHAESDVDAPTHALPPRGLPELLTDKRWNQTRCPIRAGDNTVSKLRLSRRDNSTRVRNRVWQKEICVMIVIGSAWMVRVDAGWFCTGRRGGGGADRSRGARASVDRVRARRKSVSRGMRSVSATSSSAGAPAPAQLPLHTLGARRQKTDLHVAEPTTARSCSPAPSLRSQRAKQYRFKTFTVS